MRTRDDRASCAFGRFGVVAVSMLMAACGCASEAPKAGPGNEAAAASPIDSVRASGDAHTGKSGRRTPKRAKSKPLGNPNGDLFRIPHEPFALTADVGKDNPFREAAIRSMAAAAKFDSSAAGLERVVADVNGEAILYRDFLRACVARYGEPTVSGQVNERVLLAELKGRAEIATQHGKSFEITDAEIAEGEKRFILDNPQLQGTSTEGILKMLKMTRECFRYQVYVNVASEKMFAADNSEIAKLNPMFVQIWMQQLTSRYDRTTRFGEGGETLAGDDFATVGDATITTTDVAPFLMLGLTRPRQEKALDDVIDQALVRQELQARGVAVTIEEVDARIDGERAKYSGDLFSYEAFLPFLDTSLPLECQRFRVWIALEKIFGKPTDEEILEHFEKCRPYFGSAIASACEITMLAVDPDTELPTTPDAWDKALDRMAKPIAELSAGGDFNQLVMRYSEDGPEVKKWGSTDRTGERVAGYVGSFSCRKARSEIDSSIAALTFALRDGDWAGPVKTGRGYHLVRCVEASPPRPVDLDTPSTDNSIVDPTGAATVRGQVTDDFLEDRAREFVAGLRAAAKITKHLD